MVLVVTRRRMRCPVRQLRALCVQSRRMRMRMMPSCLASSRPPRCWRRRESRRARAVKHPCSPPESPLVDSAAFLPPGEGPLGWQPLPVAPVFSAWVVHGGRTPRLPRIHLFGCPQWPCQPPVADVQDAPIRFKPQPESLAMTTAGCGDTTPPERCGED